MINTNTTESNHRNLTNEEAAGEVLLDLLMNDERIGEMMRKRCGDAPDTADEEAESNYYARTSEWYGCVIGHALTKIRHYEDDVG